MSRASRVVLTLLSIVALGAVSLGVKACVGASVEAGPARQILHVGAIPDQDPQELQRIYGTFSDYLAEHLGVIVRYVPVTEYSAAVTGFRRGDLDLVFFGGLTGVQARLEVPGAKPVAQRDVDAEFRSVFVASSAADIAPIEGVAGLSVLAGHTFTLGSQSSTSGRLMPQHFLMEAGVEFTDFAGQVGFSGSHDATIKLVEAGTYEVGALNAAVWDARIKARSVDTSRVREIFRTPPYHDYHWLLLPDVDRRFGAGFSQRVTQALLDLDGSDAKEQQVLDLFHCKRFIATSEANYQQIEAVGRAVGLIR